MKHKVRIIVEDELILETTHIRLPEKLLRFFLGKQTEAIILSPGKTITGVEICESQEKNHESNH